MTAIESRTHRRRGWQVPQRVAELEHDLDVMDESNASEFAALREDIAGLRRTLMGFALSIAGSAVVVAITVTLAFGK
ncbi:hypothetical protein UFOVP1360_10 [uncultured Caudovirales phage]|uniref:Uncharacterized protein n=1 Tax=uncultured Caudovirales phage TaxID=2100421 RepID=A0A6J5S2K4_9CAUD|nr:hypothetical protein UFOVP1360_10 [uncultured Caudovirales phage]